MRKSILTEEFYKKYGSTIREVFFLFFLLLLTLFMCLLYTVYVVPIDSLPPDSHTYLAYARNLVNFRVFSGNEQLISDSYRMPGYPLFLSVIYFIFGDGTQWLYGIRTIQAVIFFGTVIAVYKIGSISISPGVGRMCALLTALYGPYQYFSLFPLRETLSVFLLTASIGGFLSWHKSKKSLCFIISSLLYAFLILVRPDTITILPFILIWIVTRSRNLWNHAVYLFLAVSVVAGTWTIRSLFVHKSLVMLSTDGSIGFFMGQCFPPEEAWTKADKAYMDLKKSYPNEVEFQKELKRQSFLAIKSHPLTNICWGVKKIVTSFYDYMPRKGSIFWLFLSFFALYAFSKRFTDKLFILPWILSLLTGYILMVNLGGNFTLNFLKVFQIGYGDIIILGVPGYIWFIFKNRSRILFMGITIALLFNLFMFIAHFRMRLVFFDWMLLLGACVSIHVIMNIISGKKINLFQE